MHIFKQKNIPEHSNKITFQNMQTFKQKNIQEHANIQKQKNIQEHANKYTF